MAVTRGSMTDEQRKSAALERLWASDNGDTAGAGTPVLDLFAGDAQVYSPKWGPAEGSDTAHCPRLDSR